MAYKRPTVRSPPRNFKVNFIEEPPLETAQTNFIANLVPKIGRKYPSSPEEIQKELSQELCKYLKKSVGVLVVENNQNVPEPVQNHMVPVTFKFTMNEYLYKIWIHEDQVELETKPFTYKRGSY